MVVPICGISFRHSRLVPGRHRNGSLSEQGTMVVQVRNVLLHGHRCQRGGQDKRDFGGRQCAIVTAAVKALAPRGIVPTRVSAALECEHAPELTRQI